MSAELSVEANEQGPNEGPVVVVVGDDGQPYEHDQDGKTVRSAYGRYQDAQRQAKKHGQRVASPEGGILYVSPQAQERIDAAKGPVWSEAAIAQFAYLARNANTTAARTYWTRKVLG